ncbi:acetyl-CoA synthetase-like protein [Rhizodiscina lignyota]|uniref:Acetyl-CoA synthetase-like protein n=1 Tax=Rhizodiscina lignyota TaxID=1504668 RepID=A0A9P4IG05_9PEZI|nr:acetyl-CoA synthetase-like protein [Rhizodiscina lignyota]
MPSYSAIPDVHVDSVDLWTHLLGSENTKDENKHLFVDVDDESRFLSRRTVRQKSKAFGNALRTTWNWQKGDVLAIFGPNDIDWPTILFGTLWAGGCLSPISFTFTAQELAFQLKNSSTKAIVTHPAGLKTAQEAARLVGLPQSRILLFGPKDLGSKLNCKYYSELESIGPVPRRYTFEPKKDTALLVYSSGTTGLPKGVSLSHWNLVAQCIQLTLTEVEAATAGYETKLLAFLPFAHIYSIMEGVIRILATGTQVIVMPKFDFQRALAAIQKFRITYIYVAPPILLALARSPLVDQYDISSIGGIMSAAAPLATQLIEDVYTKFKIPVKQAYGMSEASPAVTHQMDWEKAMIYKGSVGTLLPNMSAKWVDLDGNEVAKGQEGELWIKGPNVFAHYHENPQATENSFSDDGWYKTGDVGYEDEHGNYYITDRVKELIKYKGYQVAPAELEAMLLKNPKVKDVAVLGMYVEEMASEVPRAFIVPTEGNKPSDQLAKEIVAWLDAQVSYPKKLRGGVQFVEEVPKSPTGKILRRLLKDKYGTKISAAKSKL